MQSTELGVVLLLALVCGVHGIGDDVAKLDHFAPVIGDYAPQICWNFTHGDWRQREFYSPGYPGNYPNSTQCIGLLVAPHGFHIRLDFRDEFHIEQSEDCKYDFFEMRDGPFGYSPPLGQYCGKNHPPLIETSSRFLWIRFNADDTIEYKGFRAVYEFFKPGNGDFGKNPNYIMCRIDMDISRGEGIMKPSDIPESFKMKANDTGQPIDCTWVIYAPSGHRTLLSWISYGDEQNRRPQDCESSFLEVYDPSTAVSDRRKQYCGSRTKAISSISNHMYLRLYAINLDFITEFEALFTIFSKGPCGSRLYDCGDDTCISRALVCNGRINCNFSWDEQTCQKTTPSAAPAAEQPIVVHYSTIILGVVGGFIITIVTLTVCIMCHQRRKEEMRHKHAIKQEQRNAVEMTTLLNRSSPRNSPLRSSGRPQRGGSPKANHVTPGKPVTANHNNNGVNAMQNRYGRNPPRTTHVPEYSDRDVSFEQTSPDGATFKRYLDVNSFNDEDSSPNPSTHNQVPAAVTVERAASPRKPSMKKQEPVGRDKSPSPRPDIVQGVKFNPEIGRKLQRHHSLETVTSDRSEVWKPIVKTNTLPNKRSSRDPNWSDTHSSSFPVKPYSKTPPARLRNPRNNPPPRENSRDFPPPPPEGAHPADPEDFPDYRNYLPMDEGDYPLPPPPLQQPRDYPPGEFYYPPSRDQRDHPRDYGGDYPPRDYQGYYSRDPNCDYPPLSRDHSRDYPILSRQLSRDYPYQPPREYSRDYQGQNYPPPSRDYREYSAAPTRENSQEAPPRGRSYDYPRHSREHSRERPIKSRDHSREREYPPLSRDHSREYADYNQKDPARDVPNEYQPGPGRRQLSRESGSFKKQKAPSQSPDIFYSRPNRGVRQHHPV